MRCLDPESTAKTLIRLVIYQRIIPYHTSKEARIALAGGYRCRTSSSIIPKNAM